MQTTTGPKRLPCANDTRHLLTMLFGTDTTVALRKAPILSSEAAIVAVYHDNEGALKRLLVCDLAFANSAGAALSVIPPGSALSAIKAGQVPDNILDNLIEVMNVAVNLFTESFGGRLELVSVLRRADLPPETVAALESPQRTKIDVAIPRYEKGRVDLISI